MKMFEKGRNYMTTAILLILTVGLAAAVRPGEVYLLSTTYGTAPTTTLATPTTLPQPQLIGGQTDSHGCLTAAGFSWNATANLCMRPWNGDIQLSAGTMMVNISDPNWRQKLMLSVPVPTSVKCIDTDNGKDYFTAGKVYVLGKNPKIDACIRHRFLREWYCNGDTTVGTFVICKEGCKNDACLPESATATTTSTTSTTIKSG